MSTLNTILASQTLHGINAKSCADALEYYVTTPPAASTNAATWFGGLRTAAGAGTTSASVALNAVQLAAEDTTAIIALTVGENSMALHMQEALKVQMRKEVAQGNLDCEQVYAAFRADTNFAN